MTKVNKMLRIWSNLSQTLSWSVLYGREKSIENATMSSASLAQCCLPIITGMAFAGESVMNDIGILLILRAWPISHVAETHWWAPGVAPRDGPWSEATGWWRTAISLGAGRVPRTLWAGHTCVISKRTSERGNTGERERESWSFTSERRCVGVHWHGTLLSAAQLQGHTSLDDLGFASAKSCCYGFALCMARMVRLCSRCRCSMPLKRNFQSCPEFVGEKKHLWKKK